MQELFARVLKEYPLITSNIITKGMPIYQLINNDIPSALSEVISDESFKIDGSTGKGHKAAIPWVGIFNKKITVSAQKGIYIVYLFKENMSGFYLTLELGATYFKNHKIGNYFKTVKWVSKYIANFLSVQNNFDTGDIYLGTKGHAKDYECATILSKYYSLNEGFTKEELSNDLKELVDIYNTITDELSRQNRTFESLVEDILNEYKSEIINYDGKNVDYKWNDFIFELLHKIHFTEDKAKILNIFNNVFIKHRIETLDNINFVSFFTLFGCDVSRQVKLDLFKNFKNAFNLTSNIPVDLSSLPQISKEHVFNKINYDKDVLGDLLASLIPGKGCEIVSDTINILKKINETIDIEILTTFLYILFPYYFLPVTEPVEKFVKDSSGYNINTEMEDYIKCLSEINDNITNFRPFVKNFLDIVKKSYLYQVDEQDEIFDGPLVGTNIIVYGTPGCGKSYFVDHELIDPKYRRNVIRTTFYLDYTYSDFVGQLVPITSEDKKEVTYDFKPGPLALAIELALTKPTEPVYLIIEELNRGNAPAIFGDIFQLLDRDGVDDIGDINCIPGQSKYPISNKNITDYLSRNPETHFYGESLYLPSNLYLIGTMNTSDQNVFALDTAFKRRWLLKKIINSFENKHISKLYVPKTDITWELFAKNINLRISQTKNAMIEEDKELGSYFVNEDILENKAFMNNKELDEAYTLTNAEKFAYKVFEYLWNDIHKLTNNIFNGAFNSLDDVVNYYLDSEKPDFNQIFDGINFYLE